MAKTKQQIVVICGPTASGKTGLALQLAKELKRANILSVDSRQVYKCLDIITGKDIPQNLPSGIKIFGLDLFSPNERANLADFVRYSKKIILDSKNSETPLIIVGGTGLYLKAITQDLTDINIPLNPKLRQKLEKLSLEELQQLLNKENPQKFTSLNHSDSMNPRRLIRYLEISRSKKILTQENFHSDDVSFHWIGISSDKNTLKENIHNRVLERIESGAINEIKDLLKNFPDKKLAIYTSLGASQIIDFIEDKVSKEKLIENWTVAEVSYAGRQTVWFKKQPDIVWYDKSTDKTKLVNQLKKIYQ